MDWHIGIISLHQQNDDNLKKNKDMNTDINISAIGAMFPSESSYMTFMDIVKDMDLELTDISLA